MTSNGVNTEYLYEHFKTNLLLTEQVYLYCHYGFIKKTNLPEDSTVQETHSHKNKIKKKKKIKLSVLLQIHIAKKKKKYRETHLPLCYLNPG